RREADDQRQLLEAQLHQAQKMQAIGTLATGIAHEFNNVLRAILANVELARMDAPQDHPMRESIEEIDKASRRARDIVQRILAFARPQPAQRRRLYLAEVAREAIRLLGPTLPAGIELATGFGADTPEILGDATQIHQLLLNLCANAAQSMGTGPGRLTVSTSGVMAGRGGEAALSGLPAGPYARLSISDSGSGIDPAIQGRIFEPFFSTKSAGEAPASGLRSSTGSCGHTRVRSISRASPAGARRSTSTFRRCTPRCSATHPPKLRRARPATLATCFFSTTARRWYRDRKS